MTVPSYQFVTHHPLRRGFIARLTVRDAQWSEVVNGNTTFTGKVTIPADVDRATLLKTALEPDESALYVMQNGIYVWGGPIISASWADGNDEVAITAADWRSWLFSILMAPDPATLANRQWIWTNKDRGLIAREIIWHATSAPISANGGITDGRPFIDYLNVPLIGKNSDLLIRGTDFKSPGSILDTLSQRAEGFEWTIGAYPNTTDGLPSLRMELSYPERGGTVEGLQFNRYNVLGWEAVEKSTADRRTRIWATSEGPSSDSLILAQDTIPTMSQGYTLLREKSTTYTAVSNRTTLAQHARQERQFLDPKTNFMTFTVGLNAPAVNTYSVGDRCRVTRKDRWLDVDYTNVRIVERVIKPDSDGGSVVVTVDLSDTVAPETDAGGAV